MKLAPSLLSADFSALLEEARSVEPYVDLFHWDVMDGHFVPNLTFGPPVVNALRDRVTLPFDIHLMIDHPAEYAAKFRIRPDDLIVFHVESSDPAGEVITTIREHGARVGISLRPGTPLCALDPHLDAVSSVLVMSVEPGFGGQAFLPDALDRIRALRAMLAGRPVDIAVDGGIHPGNAAAVLEAGADILIAGSAIFRADDRVRAIRSFREAAR